MKIHIYINIYLMKKISIVIFANFSINRNKDKRFKKNIIIYVYRISSRILESISISPLLYSGLALTNNR